MENMKMEVKGTTLTVVIDLSKRGKVSSDNLSCLVMEYCPGGDLHVLRQKQLGRCFSEPAAR